MIFMSLCCVEVGDTMNSVIETKGPLCHVILAVLSCPEDLDPCSFYENRGTLGRREAPSVQNSVSANNFIRTQDLELGR